MLGLRAHEALLANLATVRSHPQVQQYFVFAIGAIQAGARLLALTYLIIDRTLVKYSTVRVGKRDGIQRHVVVVQRHVVLPIVRLVQRQLEHLRVVRAVESPSAVRLLKDDSPWALAYLVVILGQLRRAVLFVRQHWVLFTFISEAILNLRLEISVSGRWLIQ